MLKRIATWLEAAIESVMPFSCHVCRQPTPLGRVLCDACDRAIQGRLHVPEPVADVACRCPILAMGSYEPPLSEAIKAVKYRPSTRLLEHLAGAITRVAAGLPRERRPQVLIPVPLHPSREAARGFNQARLLADLLGAAWDAPVSPAIVRIRQTRPQAECGEDERATNPVGAFALAEGLVPAAFAGKRLAIIDDVATTGATLDACAEAAARLRPAWLQAVVWAHSFRRIG
ncbi:MAG TPA: hypothetical protein PLP29_18225 [Candidatus Ozemobacteraceae bacterium]|nr:hypothetical protein [Candidatus Ozemobacteraceae bacterium]